MLLVQKNFSPTIVNREAGSHPLILLEGVFQESSIDDEASLPNPA